VGIGFLLYFHAHKKPAAVHIHMFPQGNNIQSFCSKHAGNIAYQSNLVFTLYDDDHGIRFMVYPRLL